MKTFEVFYTWNGKGIAYVEANSPEEAEEAFYNGEWEEKTDDSTDYQFERVIGELQRVGKARKMCGKCAINPKWNMFDSCEHYKGE